MKTLLTIAMMLMLATGAAMAQTGSYLVGEWQGVNYQGYDEMTFFSIVNPTDRPVIVTTVLRNDRGYVCRQDTIPEAGRVQFSSRDMGIYGVGTVQMITKIPGQASSLNDMAQIAAYRGSGYCVQPSPAVKTTVAPVCDAEKLVLMTPVVLGGYTKWEMQRLVKMCD